MSNLPEVKIGVVAVSRDCFPESLSVNRRKALMKAYTEKYGTDSVYECPVCIVESEIHMVQALEDIKKAGCNALCVYLGNFGPEISETLLAKHFDGPAMFIAAAEETQNDLLGGRGDAYCGMLNASYNLKLRNVKAYIPENPVGTAAECADMLHEFVSIARAIVGLSDLKIISFGPRPLNFLACNAPIQQLYNLNVEIEKLDGVTLEIAEIIRSIFEKEYNILLEIKKPNDIVYNQKKIGGILTETKLVGECVRDLVVGIVINTNQTEFADEIHDIATSIKNEFGFSVDNENIISEFCNLFEKKVYERIK